MPVVAVEIQVARSLDKLMANLLLSDSPVGDLLKDAIVVSQQFLLAFLIT